MTKELVPVVNIDVFGLGIVWSCYESAALIVLKADLEGSKDLRDLLFDRSNSPQFLTRTHN